MTHTPLQIGENHNPQQARSDGSQTGDRDTKTGRFLPGNKGGPGREEGSMNFKTQWRRVIKKLAEKNGISEDEIDDQMLVMVFNQIQSGNFAFYKDTIDRIYSPVTSKLELSGGLENITTTTDAATAATKALSDEYLLKFEQTLRDVADKEEAEANKKLL